VTVNANEHPAPDRFFTEDQQRRLRELMTRWRAARDAQASLPADEQEELNALVEAELRAATARAAHVNSDEAGPLP
jgi:hypothetical protein